jgi:hypothetical protein
MRYINIEDKSPSAEWCEKAEQKTEQLKRLSSSEERKDFIGNNNIWGDLKAWLLQLSHGKCWYSEAKEIFSDYDVDHFRPKLRAKDLDGTEREGYWWLAFDWKNYRICGSIGNRPHSDKENELRGKADYFPLKKESPIAEDYTCDICDEIICILDPTNPVDPPLLTFDETGYPQPAVHEGSWGYDRAKVTIKLLYLDYPPLVDERKRIWTKCILLINRAQRIMEELNKSQSVTKKTELEQTLKKLIETTSEKAPLSSTARACLLSSGLDWAKNIV